MKPSLLFLLAAALCGGCAPPPQPMAPPAPTMPQAMPAGPLVPDGAPMYGGPMSAPGSAQNVYLWRDVPVGQQVPIVQASFDQNGYQIFDASGDTIVVPFVNGNLYVMKFGRTSAGQPYFVNQGDAPVLYLRPGDAINNASVQGAQWFPIPPDYAYQQPMYVSMAPSWGAFTQMGWYPGMVAYGGMWGYHPYGGSYAWMPGYAIVVGGTRYYNYAGYRSYYTGHPGYVSPRVVYTNYPAARSSRTFPSGSMRSNGGPFGPGQQSGGTGSSFPSSSGRRGSFGSPGGSSSGSMPAPTRSYGGPFPNTGRSSGGQMPVTRRFPGGASPGAPASSGSPSGGSGSFGGTSRRSGGSFSGSPPGMGGGSYNGRSSGSGGSFGRRH